MSKDDRTLPSVTNNESINLSLPIKKRELGNFISGLLGQQQTIERDINAKFDINHLWVMNLHEMINQRILQQADAHLTDFSAVIYLEKGLKRKFKSVEALRTYSETKKLIPIGIKIIWFYLIHFPNKNYPEKQQITFSAQIHAQSRSKLHDSSKRNKSESVIANSIIAASIHSTINYQIDHTERTWGDDIETIISNEVHDIIRDETLKDTLFNYSRLILSLGILFFSFSYPIYSKYTSQNSTIDKLMQDYIVKLQKSDLDSIAVVNEKVDYLATMINVLGSRDGELFELLLFMFGPIISIVILRITRKNTSSFLVFSKQSEEQRKLKLKKEKRSFVILIASFALSILTGIVANYGFAWLTG
jgi:hypothetical protein